jgi:hypothetical protein
MKRSCLWILTLALGATAPAAAADKAAASDKGAAPAAAKAPATPAKDAPKDTSKTDIGPAEVQQYLAFFDKFVGYIDADQNDCDKMAKDLSAHLYASHALLMKAKAAHDAGKTLPETARQHIMSTAPKMAPGVQKCNSNEKVMAALQKIPR